MADEARIRDTIDAYWKTFSAGDGDGWIGLWAADATMEDPVGTPLKRGTDEIRAVFDQALTAADSVELRSLGVTIVVGNEASFAMEIRPTVGGQVFTMQVIDVMTFDDDAKITSQRAFVDFSKMRPAE
jgi:steroid delta-isomerase